MAWNGFKMAKKHVTILFLKKDQTFYVFFQVPFHNENKNWSMNISLQLNMIFELKKSYFQDSWNPCKFLNLYWKNT